MPRALIPPKTASPSAWQAEAPPGRPTGGCTRSLTRLPAMSVLPHPCALTLAGMCYSQDDPPTSYPPQPETAPARAHGPGAHRHTQPPTHTWAHPCPGSHTHTHTCLHTCSHTCIPMYMRTYILAHTCTHMPTMCPYTCLHTCPQCTHVPTHVLSHTSPHTCLHTPTHVPAHMLPHVPAHTCTRTRVCPGPHLPPKTLCRLSHRCPQMHTTLCAQVHTHNPVTLTLACTRGPTGVPMPVSENRHLGL